MSAHFLNGQPRIARQPSPCTVLLTAAVMAALTASAPAQLQFDELKLKRVGLPPQSQDANALAMGDVDGDADLDLFAGNTGQTRLYLNDGNGLFTDATAAQVPVDADDTRALALGDVDGDGDLDLVLGSWYGPSRLYLNNGSGVFTDATAANMPVVSDFTKALALGDVDGDGDLDLAIGNWYGLSRLYLNNGSGVFSDATAASLPGTSAWTNAVALGDVDGDGDLDLILGNSGQNLLYMNNGGGVFTDESAARLPVGGQGSHALALGDIDGDGDLDIVAGDDGGPHGSQDRLYLNNGSGVFTDVTAARMPVDNDLTQALVLGDVDGDGDLDLVIGNYWVGGIAAPPGYMRPTGQQNRLYLNNGSGVFTDVTAVAMPVDGDLTTAVVLGDVDGDGNLDLVVGNGLIVNGRRHTHGLNHLLLNNGSGTFSVVPEARIPRDADATGSLVLGDMDGDGDLDLVIGAPGFPSYGQDRLFLNNGSGVFADATPANMPVNNGRTLALALGDVDGDGDLDLVLGKYGQNCLYLNNGNGAFTDVTAANMPVDTDFTDAVALGDVDGDGDLDLVLGNRGQDRLYLNNGSGVFTDATTTRMPVAAGFTTCMALGDVDGDGDLDLVMGNYGQSCLYLNNGSGVFTDATAARMPVASNVPCTLALGDIDGDGDLDVVLGNNVQSSLYLNSGSGVFTDVTTARMPIAAPFTGPVVLGDVDDDGDLDLVHGNDHCLFLNNGNGVFTDSAAGRMAVDASTFPWALGDVDGDGDLDLVSGNGLQDRLHLNLLRQLDAPLYLRPGRTYTLEAYARCGPPSLVDVALPYLSTTRVSIPLPPLGILGIIPEFALPPFLIPRPAGVGHVDIAVPNLPGLVGATIYAQALLLQYPFHERLTNVTTDVIQ